MDVVDEEETLGNLEELAKKRKERLASWKNHLNKANQSDQSKEDKPLPKPKFRSYNPQDENLAVNKAELGKPASVDELIKDQLEAAKPQPIADEIDLTNLAPRKIDWDLKRNIAKKLEKLERRTKRAMAELIREKLMEEQKNS